MTVDFVSLVVSLCLLQQLRVDFEILNILFRHLKILLPDLLHLHQLTIHSPLHPSHLLMLLIKNDQIINRLHYFIHLLLEAPSLLYLVQGLESTLATNLVYLSFHHELLLLLYNNI